jgi:hypothetical protein
VWHYLQLKARAWHIEVYLFLLVGKVWATPSTMAEALILALWIQLLAATAAWHAYSLEYLSITC